MTTAYPLQWPEGWPRSKSRHPAQFHTTMQKAAAGVLREARLLNGKKVVISSNIFISHATGLPLAKQGQPKDPGVAVYLEVRGKSICIACDRWQKVEHNLRALELTIEAMRGVDRWGASDLLDRMFTGFVALPAATGTVPKRAWNEVLGVHETSSLEQCKQRYRALLREHHPDYGGSTERMAEINAAYAEREARG